MRVIVRAEGFRELEQKLRLLPNRTRKPVMVRALKKAAEPTVQATKSLAPVGEGDLRDSIIVSTRLSARQKGLARNTKSTAEVYIGPSGDGTEGVLNYAWHVEFGTERAAPHAYLRPAWDRTKAGAIELIRRELSAAIEKSLRRAR